MQNRREFIGKVLRTTALSVLVGGSGYLLFKEQSDEKCNLDFICQNCKKVKDCKLPEADSFKKSSVVR